MCDDGPSAAAARAFGMKAKPISAAAPTEFCLAKTSPWGYKEGYGALLQW